MGIVDVELGGLAMTGVTVYTAMAVLPNMQCSVADDPFVDLELDFFGEFQEWES